MTNGSEEGSSAADLYDFSRQVVERLQIKEIIDAELDDYVKFIDHDFDKSGSYEPPGEKKSNLAKIAFDMGINYLFRISEDIKKDAGDLLVSNGYAGSYNNMSAAVGGYFIGACVQRYDHIDESFMKVIPMVYRIAREIGKIDEALQKAQSE